MPENNIFNRKIKVSTVIVLVLALAALVALIWSAVSFVRIYQLVQRQGISLRHPRQLFSRQLNSPQRRLLVADIRGWMTFSFVNRVFTLPPDYLKTKLNINDKKYPNISFDSWAKAAKQDPNQFLTQIKILVGDYQNASSTTPLK